MTRGERTDLFKVSVSPEPAVGGSLTVSRICHRTGPDVLRYITEFQMCAGESAERNGWISNGVLC